METYFSPSGNPEIWLDRPKGYFTKEEWAAKQPQPPLPTLEEAIAAKLSEITSAYEAAFAPIEQIYPSKEREGWPIQLDEARAVLADPEAKTPTLDILVAERAMGESVIDFAQVVVANNAFFRPVYATLTGQQQRMYRDVESMAVTPGITAAEVLAYPVIYTMPEGL